MDGRLTPGMTKNDEHGIKLDLSKHVDVDKLMKMLHDTKPAFVIVSPPMYAILVAAEHEPPQGHG